jgi:hypothetical protein
LHHKLLSANTKKKFPFSTPPVNVFQSHQLYLIESTVPTCLGHHTLLQIARTRVTALPPYNGVMVSDYLYFSSSISGLGIVYLKYALKII